MDNKLLRLTDTTETQVALQFECVGCGYAHCFTIQGHEHIWQWNGDMINPTFQPSLLVWGSDPLRRCHLFVRNGKIEYLSDCFHDLKGQTVDMLDIE